MQYFWRYVLFYAMAQWIGVGGALFLLRTMSDPLSVVSTSGFNLALAGVPWILTLALFGMMLVYAVREGKLKSAGAIVCLLCVCQGVFFGIETANVFNAPLQTPLKQEVEKAKHYARQKNKALPLVINDLFTLTKIDVQSRQLFFYYDFTKDVSEAELKQVLNFMQQDACPYFHTEEVGSALISVRYIFQQSGKLIVDHAIRKMECAMQEKLNELRQQDQTDRQNAPSIPTPAPAPVKAPAIAPAPVAPPTPSANNAWMDNLSTKIDKIEREVSVFSASIQRVHAAITEHATQQK